MSKTAARVSIPRRFRFLFPVALGLALTSAAALAAGVAGKWPMSQADAQHTGRADVVIPAARMNSGLLDVFLWQTPTGEAADSGWVASTQMTFYDGAGPDVTDIVLGTYHWPKGVSGLDRHTGRTFWSGNPSGGETIGNMVPAFSPDGATVYVINDATATPEFPAGTPLMAFLAAQGPSVFWHNGADADPADLEMCSPVVGPDGRIFMHRYDGRPAAGTDGGGAIARTWLAAGGARLIDGDVSLYEGADGLRVLASSLDGFLTAWDGATGGVAWQVSTPGGDAAPSIDPASGRAFAAVGEGDVFVVGVNAAGQALWTDPYTRVYQYVEGVNHRARVASPGCLSWDGGTYYFQTVTAEGDGQLFALDTGTGLLKWTYDTHSAGWGIRGSAPIVTHDGVVIVGNNGGRTYYALRDDGTHATLIDTLPVVAPGEARASASLAPDGLLYLPLQTTWRAGNGDRQSPTYRVEKLFTAIDLSAGAVQELWPPGFQRALARNHAVLVKWQPLSDGSGAFAHYAIYRATEPFVSVDGMTPIATVPAAGTGSYLDTSALNGTPYYYAVTAVSTAGAERRDVPGVGPRTPHDETDLQVVTIERTPRFPRYAPWYEDRAATDPNGFGPYGYSAAMGLGEGQTSETPRWPDAGAAVTYTATIRNRGTNAWSGALGSEWTVDGESPVGASQPVSLDPGGTATFTLGRTWDGLPHDIRFAITPGDARASNDELTVGSKSVAFLTYIDETYAENFREDSAEHPGAATDDIVDWLNRHMARFNALFAAAGSPKRVHYGVLQVLEDPAADPSVPTIDYAIFPFRFRAPENNLRHISGWYDPAADIDFGLLHEEGHQLGLIDVYQLNLAPEQNLVSGRPYSAPPCLMNACSPFLSTHSANAMTHWQDDAHGYFGQYLYELPQSVALRFTGNDGGPLAGATMTVYQMADRPGIGKVITDQVKAQGVTDANGVFTLPNVPVDPALVPPVGTGDALHDNPFGYVAVIGTNGLLHARVSKDGFSDWVWLDISEVNNAYWAGQTTIATFERPVRLGGPVLTCLPGDMTELNAAQWSAWADGGTATATDDTAFARIGAASLRAATNGGFDNAWTYPGGALARWDLSGATHFRFWAYHVNDNGFQNGSPWIILRGAGGYIELHATWDILGDAYGQWTYFSVPLAGDATWIRTDHGAVSLAAIDSIEFHADTWDYGFTLWLDGVGFDPAQPGEAADLTLSGAPLTTLAWTPTPQASAYDVSRGVVSGLPGSDFGACLAPQVATTTITDGDAPAAGQGFVYLVRATAPTCGGVGTWGRASDGSERVNVNAAGCP